MKESFTFIVTLMLAAGLLLTQEAGAQSPEKISYQAVIRDTDENLVTNQSIGMQISILQGSENGTEVYVERQFPSTNANGLIRIEIGNGTVVSGDFISIDWSYGPYFIKTETDLDGGANYTITGTSQLLSVPYALHAKEADPSVPSGTQTGEMQYWNGTEWTTITAGSEGQILILIEGVPTWKTVAGVTTLGPTDVYNPATDEIWMDRNLGASQVATSSTDADSYGDLYQWGRASDGHESRTSNTTATLSNSDTPGHGDFITNNSSPYDWRNTQNDNLWQGVSGINNPCPSGYRLPTEAEWEAERTSWGSNNSGGAFDSPLKLPLAGFRNLSNGSLHSLGTHGYYWSSTADGTNSRSLYFYSSNASLGSSRRAYGNSVRCLKD